MILSGAHKPASKVVVVQNFIPDKVSSPGVANAAEKPFYDNDVAAVAEMIMRAFPERQLSPRVMLAAMDHDIRATRAALAAHENLDASAMKVERYGNPAEALAYLEAILH